MTREANSKMSRIEEAFNLGEHKNYDKDDNRSGVTTKDTRSSNSIPKGQQETNQSFAKNMDQEGNNRQAGPLTKENRVSLSVVEEESGLGRSSFNQTEDLMKKAQSEINFGAFMDFIEEALCNRLQSTVNELKELMTNLDDDRKYSKSMIDNYLDMGVKKSKEAIAHSVDRLEDHMSNLISNNGPRGVPFKIQASPLLSSVRWLAGDNPLSSKNLESMKQAMNSELKSMHENKIKRLVHNFEGQLKVHNKAIFDTLKTKLKTTGGGVETKEELIKFIHQKNQADSEFLFEMENCVDNLKTRISKL